MKSGLCRIAHPVKIYFPASLAGHDFSVMLHVNWIIARPAQTGLTSSSYHHASQEEIPSPERHGPFHSRKDRPARPRASP
jgi:hypothetical protein